MVHITVGPTSKADSAQNFHCQLLYYQIWIRNPISFPLEMLTSKKKKTVAGSLAVRWWGMNNLSFLGSSGVAGLACVLEYYLRKWNPVAGSVSCGKGLTMNCVRFSPATPRTTRFSPLHKNAADQRKPKRGGSKHTQASISLFSQSKSKWSEPYWAQKSGSFTF